MATDVVTIAQQGTPGEGIGDHADSATITHITRCTSGTRPETPYDGQVIYETDTKDYRKWDGDEESWELLIPDITPTTASLVCLVERRTTEQSISGNSRQTVLFNHVHINEDDIYNNVTGEFELGTGHYLVVYNTAWDSDAEFAQWVQILSGTTLPENAVCAHDSGGSARAGSCSGGLTIISATARFRARVGNDGGGRKLSAYAYSSPHPDTAVTSLAIYKYP